jgi:ATP-dependent Clp protease protease subunit
MKNSITLPQFDAQALQGLRYEPPASVMARWNRDIKAKAGDDKNTIDIYDYIGDDGFGGGFGLKRLSAALRSFDGADAVVNVNSGGGSFFDGVAMYNQLRDYDGKVTVNVVGLAGSAASIVAMAGDEIRIAKSAFFMVHNTWVLAMGNRHDMVATAKTLAAFDESMAGVYAARTGAALNDIKKMMDAETWLGGEAAVDAGFADGLMQSDEIDVDDDAPQSAIRVIDVALAKAGKTRTERRALIKEITGTHDAAAASTHDAAANATLNAGDNAEAMLREIVAQLNTLKG